MKRVVMLALLATACAHAAPDTVARPATMAADGATDWFGPGVTAVRGEGTSLRLNLLRPANVVALQLLADGSVLLLESRQLEAGQQWYTVPPQPGRSHIVEVPQRATSTEGTNPRAREVCHINEGRTGTMADPGKPPAAQPPGPGCFRISSIPVSETPAPTTRSIRQRQREPDHILLIASDSAFTLAELGERLGAVREFEFATVAHDLPEYLVGRRTPMWAGYLVAR